MDDEKTKGRPGRKPFIPTDEQRAVVVRLAGDGTDRCRIAAAIGVSLPTLRKTFAAELSSPAAPDLFSVAQSAPPSAERRPSAGGRPPYRPNDFDRNRLIGMFAGGATLRAVADVLSLSEPTLRRYYGDEIERAAELMRARNLDLLARAARAGKIRAIEALDKKIDQAELASLAGSVGGSERGPKKGKKELAADAAAEVAGSGDWGGLIGRSTSVQ